MPGSLTAAAMAIMTSPIRPKAMDQLRPAITAIRAMNQTGRLNSAISAHTSPKIMVFSFTEYQ